MKYEIEVNAEEIIAQELRSVYESFMNYLAQERTSMFHFDEPAKERIELAKHAEAARLLHNYYCMPADQILEY